MKILFVHNSYGKFSGEEAVVANQIALLKVRGHQICTFTRSSFELTGIIGSFRAFLAGLRNPYMKSAFRTFLAENRPDVVHVHNLYPLISPSILPECKKAEIPVVMTVHNYRLVCPNGLHLPKGCVRVCEKCCGGHEYWCVLKNCEQSYCKSFGYALRNYVARRHRLFLDNVTMYTCLTDFQRNRLVSEGYPKERLAVVPNMIEIGSSGERKDMGEYVGYIGRVSPEKGLQCLIETARQLPHVVFNIAGNCDLMKEIKEGSPENARFMGQVSRDKVDDFIANSRVIVLPSIWFEGFPMVLLEAMRQGKPVIASKIGGIPEIVDHGVTGLLCESGNAVDLAEKIQYLWDRPALCRQMGQAGREKALREYSFERYYDRLMDVYQKALSIRPPHA